MEYIETFKTCSQGIEKIKYIMPLYPKTLQHFVHYIHHKRSNRTLSRSEINAVKSYSRQLIKALQYLHFHAIVHRDIHPANIYLNYQNCQTSFEFGTVHLGHFTEAIDLNPYTTQTFIPTTTSFAQ